MMWAIVVIVVTLLIAAIQIPSLRKKHLNRELWVFGVLLFIGFGLATAKSLQLPLPNPLDGITILVSPISRTLAYLLK